METQPSTPNKKPRTCPHHSPGDDPRIAFFNHHAAAWDDDREDQRNTLARLEALKGRIGLRPGLKVLEVGCGTGLVTAFLTEATGGNVLAADFSKAMIERARARGLAAKFIELDICRKSPPGGPFDLVFCFHAFPHFSDQAAALRHMAAALAPGGRMVILHLASSGHINGIHRDIGGAVAEDLLPGVDAWPGLLKQAGLELRAFEDREELFILEAVHPASTVSPWV
jgi:SAM-dependent methyltransferase